VKRWELRLPDYANAAPLELDLINGLRYLAQFEALPIEETVSVVEQN
jgi:hypothetical protein